MTRIQVLAAVLVFGFVQRTAHAEPVSGTQGMVAAAHPDAAAAGMQMLRAGGTACDAAVAVAFTLAVVEPYSSGIGGGGFALLRVGKSSAQFMDFREVAPSRAQADMYQHAGAVLPNTSRDGPLSVAVPGAVAGYVALHTRCGKLPLAQVMAPAIKAAAEGIPVDLRYYKFALQRASVLRRDPEAARIFLAPRADGVPGAPDVGSLFVQKDLAKTLERIAHDGADVFYKGPMAAAMVKSLVSKGGIISVEDFAAYKVRDRAPLTGLFRGNLVVTAPPPSSGGQILLTLLNFMETLPSHNVWHDTLWLRTFIEGSKRAYADRALLGDPEFVPEVAHDLPLLLSKERAATLAPTFKKVEAAKNIPAGQGTVLAKVEAPVKPEGHHTTHLSVLDAAGNAVTMTTTLNYSFGSGVVAANTGVLWNDEMDDFAVDVGVPNAYGIAGSAANRVAPGKVPLSSMTPTLVFAGANEDAPLRLVIGSPGGSRIPSSVAQVMLAVLDGGADVRTAVNLGRVHHQHLPDEVQIEQWGMDPATQAWLQGLGYTLRPEAPWCNVMAIGIDPATGVRTAAADPRGVGVALAQ